MTLAIPKGLSFYREARSPQRTCHVCTHIRLHGDAAATCTLVEGTVDRLHVCSLFWRSSS